MKVDTANYGKYRIVAEINMIPFIDIALVLLIIFMVMTPFLIRAQIKLNIPEAAKTEKRVEDKDSLTVQVEKDGGIFIAGRRVSIDDVPEMLSRQLHDPEKQPLFVEADKDVSFSHVVDVLDAGKQCGIAKMGICVKPEKSRTPSRRP